MMRRGSACTCRWCCRAAADPGLRGGLAGGRAHSPQWQERALAARLRRQQILDRADGTAPRLVAVITEASLMYRWGSQQDRQAQVAHLAAMSRRPNVELRLLRFADGLHPGMISPFNIFDFPDDEDPSVVYLENDTGIQEVTKADEVERLPGHLRPDPRRSTRTGRHQDPPRHPQQNPGVSTNDRPVPSRGARLPAAAQATAAAWRSPATCRA